MKLAYIILILIFFLTASYGLEKFFAVQREKKSAGKVADKLEIKRVQYQVRRNDAGKATPESDCDMHVLLSNNFFDQSRNVVSGRSENLPAESKLANTYQLTGVLEIGDCKAAVIVNKNQPQRGPPVKGKVADKRIFLLGDTLGNGYKLSEIEQKSVKFTLEGREQELAMFQGKKGSVQAGPGNMPGLPPGSSMARPLNSFRGGVMERGQ